MYNARDMNVFGPSNPRRATPVQRASNDGKRRTVERLGVAACALLVVAGLAMPRVQAATDLSVQYSALQRLLAAQAFTQDGRRYVKGTPADRCSYGYLESPRVDADGARLRVRARFSGRSALDVFGHCVGLGDSFDLVIVAVPYFANGSIRLRDVRVDPVKGGFYANRVCRALAGSLPQQFDFPLAVQAKAAVEQASDGGYRRELKRFAVTSIQVRQDALVLTLDFELAVR